MRTIITLSAAALLAAAFSANAATVTVFDDDFSADSEGVTGFDTVTEITNWNVIQGNIDVLGASFGCIGCLDLDGSFSPATAVLETKAAFDHIAARDYRFQLFFSGGTQQETVTVSFAGASASFLAGRGASVFDGIIGGDSDLFSTIQISLSGPLNNFGPYLDRVLVTYQTDGVAPIPLPGAAPLLLAALAGLGAVAGRRRPAS